jgi:protein-S-isoprenylcysteine O-methyltransferase Ste14
MRPSFAGRPETAVVFFITLAVWAILETRQALHGRGEATSMDRGSLLVVRIFAAAGVLLAALAAARVKAAAFPYSPLAFGLSLGLAWAGIGLRWWSFQTLGHYFTFRVMTSADQRVITTGPYRYLRHPSYAGILLILTGIGLSYGNWLSLAALVLLPLVGFINRIRVEEAALAAILGDA